MKDELKEQNGKVTLENKVGEKDTEVNAVDLGDDMAESVRKAETLCYLQGGGSVDAELAKTRKEMPELVEHTEVDELYPKA